MSKYPRQYNPVVQLLLIGGLYIVFIIIMATLSFILTPLLSGYSLIELRNADVAIPAVRLTWKLTTFIDPIGAYLIPAMLFVRITGNQPVAFFKLDKPIRIWPALFVVSIMLMGHPIAGILYDWNYTLDMAQSSIQSTKEWAAASDAIMYSASPAYLFLNLIAFALVSAIAKECFFRGVLQQVFMKMLPKHHWIAIFITAVVFSVSYVQWQWFVPVVFVGIQLGAIYYFTGNLWLCIIGDFIFGSANWIQSYSRQLGWTTEDPLSPSATPWYTALVCLLATAGLLWYYRKHISKPVMVLEYQDEVEAIGAGDK